MKNLRMCFLFLLIMMFFSVSAQVPDKTAMAKGMNFIETRIYSAEDDAKILELYKNLRVSDVSDGLDMVGLPGTGLVCPGDVVVGDGDGVVVVPRAVAEQVAKYANEILTSDKAGRKGLYKKLGMPLDKTVQ